MPSNTNIKALRVLAKNPTVKILCDEIRERIINTVREMGNSNDSDSIRFQKGKASGMVEILGMIENLEKMEEMED